MKNLILKLKLFYLNKIIIPKYTKNAMIFGEMLSYSYMGEPIGFAKRERLNLKYAGKLIEQNLKPWDYNEMAAVGWGHALPELKQFGSEMEKIEWLKDNLVDHLLTKEVQKTNFAQKISSMLKD
jgi:hypothetical protein